MSQKDLKYPRLSPWEQVELLERAAQGETLQQLALLYGLNKTTVWRMYVRYHKEAQARRRAVQRAEKRASA